MASQFYSEAPRTLPGGDAMFAHDASDLHQEMSRLVDLLAGLRADLTTGVLPRAAKVTGTTHRIFAAVDCVDAVLGIAKGVLMRSPAGSATDQRPDERDPSRVATGD